MSHNGQIEIIPYNSDCQEIWDQCVEESKNGTFLFMRDYMDYHSDRFQDKSFLFEKKGKVIALLPANLEGDKLYSHRGLTYGGLVMNPKITAQDVLTIFDILLNELKKQGINELIYKTIPYIYHQLPSDEDLYALFRNNASLTIRNISSAILMDNRLKFRDIRKAGIKKAIKHQLSIIESEDYSSAWLILSDILSQKYSKKPVHTLEEMTLLAQRFPQNIKLFLVLDGKTPISGAVCYISPNTVHAQYIFASLEGKATGALDYLFNYLINEKYSKKYFDFGISTEDNGRYLNESLIYQKEGFGGRAVCYDTYNLKIK